VKGAGTDNGELTVTCPTRRPGATARIKGTIGGRAVDLASCNKRRFLGTVPAVRLFRRRKRDVPVQFVEVDGMRVPVATPAPNTLIIGDDLVRGFADPGPPPTQDDLDRVIGPATAVAVRDVFAEDDVLYETDDAADLASLRDALRIEGEMGHCMCSGTVALVFRRGGENLGTVTLHHGESLRWEPFFDNAPLVESDPILDWLSARGVTGPREEFDEAEREAQEYAEVKIRWQAAMPAALRPIWSSILESGSDWGLKLEWPEVAEVMAREYPDPVLRARALLEWYGQGAGPWSGCPAYEQAPEWCLLQLPLDVLVRAAETQPQTEALLEGAARFFAGWDFGQHRGEELAQLPPDLERRLLEHSLASPDDDKRSRARNAFAP
jgi:hypothetical protein